MPLPSLLPDTLPELPELRESAVTVQTIDAYDIPAWLARPTEPDPADPVPVSIDQGLSRPRRLRQAFTRGMAMRGVSVPDAHTGSAR